MNIVKQFRQIKKFPSWIFFLPAMLMKIYCICFFRKNIIDPCKVCDDGRKYVVTVWHNRLFFLPFAFPAHLRRKTKAVISPSRDGQYLSDFISFLGVQSLRGSSSKKGAKALFGGVKAIEDGGNVAITPDGPRGPKYQMKTGPVHLASLSGAKVVPVGINYSRYWELKSWDGFQIPKPFARVTITLGTPFTVPADADTETLEKFRVKLQEAQQTLTVDRAKIL